MCSAIPVCCVMGVVGYRDLPHPLLLHTCILIITTMGLATPGFQAPRHEGQGQGLGAVGVLRRPLSLLASPRSLSSRDCRMTR